MADILLNVEGMKVYYPVKGDFGKGREFVKAVDGVSFEVRKGEVFGIVGESGCGKSTLGRGICKLETPTAGKIVLSGEDISSYGRKQMRSVRKKVQMVFQDPYASLNPRMSIFDIIAEPLIIHGLTKSKKELEDRVMELLRKVGLDDYHANRYPHEFSGGQRQRIGIARALAVEPEFIVCDEPISALDVSIQAQIVNLLIRLQKEKGLTYLFIAHDLAMVKHISDRVAVMYLGNIVEITQASALYANPMHPYTQALLSAIPIPDPEVEEKKQRIRLEGELPSPVDPPEGCRFINRCRFASERCRKERPELMEMEPGHLVACHCCEEMKKGQI